MPNVNITYFLNLFVVVALLLLNQTVTSNAAYNQYEFTMNLTADPAYITDKDNKILDSLKMISVEEVSPQLVNIQFLNYLNIKDLIQGTQNNNTGTSDSTNEQYYILMGSNLDNYYKITAEQLIAQEGKIQFTNTELSKYDSEHYIDGTYFAIALAKTPPQNIPEKSGTSKYKGPKGEDVPKFVNLKDGLFIIGLGFSQSLNINYEDPQKTERPTSTTVTYTTSGGTTVIEIPLQSSAQNPPQTGFFTTMPKYTYDPATGKVQAVDPQPSPTQVAPSPSPTPIPTAEIVEPPNPGSSVALIPASSTAAFSPSLPSVVLITVLSSFLLLWFLHAATTGRS